MRVYWRLFIVYRDLEKIVSIVGLTSVVDGVVAKLDWRLRTLSYRCELIVDCAKRQRKAVEADSGRVGISEGDVGW